MYESKTTKITKAHNKMTKFEDINTKVDSKY